MNKDKKTEEVQVPVTFLDKSHIQRTIKVGEDELHVEGGKITVTDQAHIEALDKEYCLTREKS